MAGKSLHGLLVAKQRQKALAPPSYFWISSCILVRSVDYFWKSRWIPKDFWKFSKVWLFSLQLAYSAVQVCSDIDLLFLCAVVVSFPSSYADNLLAADKTPLRRTIQIVQHNRQARVRRLMYRNSTPSSSFYHQSFYRRIFNSWLHKHVEGHRRHAGDDGHRRDKPWYAFNSRENILPMGWKWIWRAHRMHIR